jgi:hypothetical protein
MPRRSTNIAYEAPAYNGCYRVKKKDWVSQTFDAHPARRVSKAWLRQRLFAATVQAPSGTNFADSHVNCVRLLAGNFEGITHAHEQISGLLGMVTQSNGFSIAEFFAAVEGVQNFAHVAHDLPLINTVGRWCQEW